MWEKRKEELPTRPSPIATPAPEPVRPAATPVPGSEVRRGTAVIGKAMKIKGEIQSREDLIVDGEVEGAVELNEHCLTVGPNGKARSNVRAREVVVLGTIHGNVEASDKIAIRKDGKLVGDIKTAGIIIEDGAYFKGSIDIVKAEAKAAAPKALAAAAGPNGPAATAASPAPVSNVPPAPAAPAQR